MVTAISGSSTTLLVTICRTRRWCIHPLPPSCCNANSFLSEEGENFVAFRNMFTRKPEFHPAADIPMRFRWLVLNEGHTLRNVISILLKTASLVDRNFTVICCYTEHKRHCRYSRTERSPLPDIGTEPNLQLGGISAGLLRGPGSRSRRLHRRPQASRSG